MGDAYYSYSEHVAQLKAEVERLKKFVNCGCDKAEELEGFVCAVCWVTETEKENQRLREANQKLLELIKDGSMYGTPFMAVVYIADAVKEIEAALEGKE
jgi:cell division septum initiation protein DivIVA